MSNYQEWRMTEAEHEFVMTTINAFKEASQRVSPWEEGFMQDMAIRVEKYGVDTYISAKQWAVVEKIAKKLDIEKAIDLDVSQ
jgi:hypothetical protein